MNLDIQQLIKMLNDGEPRKLPPVHLWHPEQQGIIDICIDDSMNWYHEGDKFERLALVKLFSSILRKDTDGYFLVTPAEKLAIAVEDVPFEIISLAEWPETGQWLVITNVEDSVLLDANTNIELRDYKGVEIPYIEVRDGLFARISRPVFYQLVEMAEPAYESGMTQYSVHLGDAAITLGRIFDD